MRQFSANIFHNRTQMLLFKMLIVSSAVRLLFSVQRDASDTRKLAAVALKKSSRHE